MSSSNSTKFGNLTIFIFFLFSCSTEFTRIFADLVRKNLICRLFENAAIKLKLSPLLSFCSAVCSSSEKQLRMLKEDGSRPSRWWVPKPSSSVPPPPLLLSRLSQLLIKSARSGRPLVHVMKLWSAVGPHLMHVCKFLLFLKYFINIFLVFIP